VDSIDFPLLLLSLVDLTTVCINSSAAVIPYNG
jgi:hypothetical protein